MARADFRFSYPKRVRISEIDHGSVVFNARYLDYLDIVLTEYLRAVRISEAGPGEAPGLGAPHLVAHTAIDYRASIRFDEQIDLHLRCTRIGTSSLTLAFEFHGPGDADDLRSAGETVIVHLSADGAVPTPLPAALIALIETYEGRSLRA